MKILYVAGALLTLFVTYFLITSYWTPLMTPAIQTAVSATDNTTYPFANAAIRAMPIWLYIAPAVIVLVAIVIKLRSKQTTV
jgi:hypothetical protein